MVRLLAVHTLYIRTCPVDAQERNETYVQSWSNCSVLGHYDDKVTILLYNSMYSIDVTT